MTFTFREGLIWIPVEIVYEGQTVTIENCIVDTGSATTAFDIDLVVFNYQKPAFIRRLCGLGGGTQEVISQRIDLLKIDTANFSGIDIEFGDISSQFGINGFIGNDVLCQCAVNIDFPKQEFRIHQTVETDKKK